MCLVRSPTHSKKYDIKSLSIPSTENCLLPSQGLSSWVKMNRKQLFYIVQITTMEAKSRKSQTGPVMYCDRKSSKFSHLQQQIKTVSIPLLRLNCKNDLGYIFLTLVLDISVNISHGWAVLRWRVGPVSATSPKAYSLADGMRFFRNEWVFYVLATHNIQWALIYRRREHISGNAKLVYILKTYPGDSSCLRH